MAGNPSSIERCNVVTSSLWPCSRTFLITTRRFTFRASFLRDRNFDCSIWKYRIASVATRYGLFSSHSRRPPPSIAQSS